MKTELEMLLYSAGLTRGEVEVYKALLQLGKSTSGPIAKGAGVARSKLYEILSRLAKKGLASHAKKNNTLYFSPAPPSRILDFLKNQEDGLRVKRLEAEKAIPSIAHLYSNIGGQEAEVFEGLEGLKNAREKHLSLMKKGEAVLFLGVPSSAYSKMEAYYADWNGRRIRKGINSYTIFTDEARRHSYVMEKINHPHTFVRFLPKNANTPSWIEIYPQAVVIAINEGKPMSIVIENRLVAASFKSYFEIMWKTAKS